MGDVDDINMLFQTVDSNENGYIDKEKLQRLCPHLSQVEIDTIFNDFDKDHDNRICLKELIQSNEYSSALYKQNAVDYQYNTEENMAHIQISEIFNNLPW
jgi:Ca2+-binding EF-hand superfamily protein